MSLVLTYTLATIFFGSLLAVGSDSMRKDDSNVWASFLWLIGFVGSVYTFYSFMFELFGAR
jgi:hypothetical protein